MDLPCPVVGLPIEILIRITNQLNTDELCAMRLTCKSIEQALFHSFGHEFFHKKQFMLFDESLQALIDISRHASLSPLLRHVIIGLDYFSVTERVFPNADMALSFVPALGKHVSLIRTGRAVQMLAEAFRGLANLETVEIRDFDSQRKTRSGARWRSYGSPTIERKIGHSLWMTNDPTHENVSTWFAIVLDALAVADAHPKNLEVLMRTRSAGLGDYAFDLTSLATSPKTAVVSTLRRLHLELRLMHIQAHTDTRGEGRDTGLTGMLLHRFLAEAHALTELRLNFQNMHDLICNSFLECLGLQGPLPTTLQHLDIGFATVSPSVLFAIWDRFPLLSTVRLWKVRIEMADDAENKTNNWETVLGQLAQLPALRSVSIGCVAQTRTYSDNLLIQFDGESSFNYTGGDIKEYLLNMANKTVPIRRVLVTDEDDEDEQVDGVEEEPEEEEEEAEMTDGDDDDDDEDDEDDEED